jgi:hypothetical protein
MKAPWTSSFEDLINGTTPSTPPTDGVINGMKQPPHSGAGKQLQLSEAAQQKYTALIKEYRNALTELRNKAAGLTHYGDVGLWYSALETKIQLMEKVTPEFVASLNGYIAYLEQFENAVNSAFNQMEAEDKGR